MKRTDLIRKLESEGCILIPAGEIMIGTAIRRPGASQPIPRHREVGEFLARHILKKLTA